MNIKKNDDFSAYSKTSHTLVYVEQNINKFKQKNPRFHSYFFNFFDQKRRGRNLPCPICRCI